ncbi:MAG: hypothetical protein Q9182_000001 [Xanthomendoza sp. 2 TL-2023]
MPPPLTVNQFEAPLPAESDAESTVDEVPQSKPESVQAALGDDLPDAPPAVEEEEEEDDDEEETLSATPCIT